MSLLLEKYDSYIHGIEREKNLTPFFKGRKQFQDPIETAVYYLEQLRLLDIFQNLVLKTFSFESLESFKKAPVHTQIKVADKLTRYFFLMQVLETNPEALRSTQSLLKYLSQKWKIKFQPGFIESVQQDDIVEIYDADFCQVFRNHRFLEACSYDLLRVEIEEWPQLFERSPTVTGQLIQEAQYLLMESQELYFSKTGPHLMKERNSEAKKVFEIQVKSGSTVFSEEGERIGFVCSQSAKLLESETSPGKIEFLRRPQ